MLIRILVLAGCAMFAAIAGAIATAQPAPACAPDDLRCRVERLEARLAALEAAPPQSQAQGGAPPQVVYESLTETVRARRACRTDCAVEAAALCAERGFHGGRAEDWERPRSGPVMLTRAECNRR